MLSWFIYSNGPAAMWLQLAEAQAFCHAHEHKDTQMHKQPSKCGAFFFFFTDSSAI